jgi:hypothetical protein
MSTLKQNNNINTADIVVLIFSSIAMYHYFVTDSLAAMLTSSAVALFFVGVSIIVDAIAKTKEPNQLV